MISILTHGSRARKTKHEAAAKEFERLCVEVSATAKAVKTHLENGAGDAIKRKTKFN